MRPIVGIYAATPYQAIAGMAVARNFLKADACILFLKENMLNTDRQFHINSKDSYVKGVYYLKPVTPISRTKYFLARFEGLCTGQFSKNYPYIYEKYRSKPLRPPYFSALIASRKELCYLQPYLKNSQAAVYLTEDGLGEYFFGPELAESFATRIFYASDFYNSLYHTKVLPAPKISVEDKEMTAIMDNLFEVNDAAIAKIENSRCIYLHQPFPENSDFERIEEKIIRYLEHKFKDRFLLKLHVRETDSKYPKLQTLNTLIPFEALYPHVKRSDELVLIGVHSTSLLSPKLMFGQNVKVICLANFFDRRIIDETEKRIAILNGLFSHVRSTYDDASKVMLPNNENELMVCLNSL